MAEGESKKASGTCASCQRLTTHMCAGCLEAPLYDERFTEPTFYCNPECQKADWTQHKSKCKKLQARKSLGRAAMLLQAIFYRIRLRASTLRFKSLRLAGSTIFLDDFQFASEFHSRESGQALKPFPVPLDGDRSLAEAVLVYMGSMEAMAYLHGFAKELMTGFSSKIEESAVSVFDRKLQICPVSSNGQQPNLPDSISHYLYKVTLKNGEVWVVDTTGAQYGYPDPLCPWPGFEQRRSCKVVIDYEFGAIRQRFNQFMAMRPERHIVAEMTEKRELAEAIEEMIPALAQACGGKLNVIVRGSDAAFKEAKDRFLDQLEDHLRVSMTKRYTADQIARRNQRIESYLSQIVADPDSQKLWAGLTKILPSAIGTRKGSASKDVQSSKEG